MGKQEKETNKPAFEARLNHIRVSVWENAGDNGNRWFNTTITRRYKDGDEFKDATSFGGIGDLCLVAEAARLARNFIQGEEFQQAHEEL